MAAAKNGSRRDRRICPCVVRRVRVKDRFGDRGTRRIVGSLGGPRANIVSEAPATLKSSTKHSKPQHQRSTK
jgi:hypothetical protein